MSQVLRPTLRPFKASTPRGAWQSQHFSRAAQRHCASEAAPLTRAGSAGLRKHAEYALELFRQFGLQLLIVAPLDAKARVTQPYVGCYLHVNKRDNRSEIFEMTAEEFDQSVELTRTRGRVVAPGFSPARHGPNPLR